MIRVLITGAGGAAAVSLIRCLSDTCEVYAADIDPNAVGLYLVPPERRMLLPRGTDPAFRQSVLDACRTLNIDVLFPTVDWELLPVAQMRWMLLRSGTRPVVAPAAALEVCLDKWKLLQALGHAVPVPECVLLDERFDPHSVTYPRLVKPREGAGSRGIRVIRDASEFADLPRDGTRMVQQYMPGEEYSVDVLMDERGRAQACVPRLRMKVDSGVAVAARTVHDAELEHLSAIVVETVGLRFVANVQWRRDEEGCPRLLEINARFPGTMPLTVAAGVDMPHLALSSILGHPIPVLDRHKEIALVRHWEEVAVPLSELGALTGASFLKSA